LLAKGFLLYNFNWFGGNFWGVFCLYFWLDFYFF